MKKYTILIYLFILLMTSSPTLSKNWYVDGRATGLNNGMSWSNAWNRFSKINWGENGILAGDTLFISGGEEFQIYSESLIINWGGDYGNPIVIKIGQDAGHRGTVIIDGQRKLENCFYIPNYVILDGEVEGAIRLQCKNSTADGLYSQRQATGITVRYVEIYNCGLREQADGIELRQPRDCVIEFCHIHDNYQNGIKMTGSRGSWGSNSIRFNEIAYNCDDGISGRNGLDIYGNKIFHQGIKCATGHPDGIQTMGNYVQIVNNEIYDNYTQQIILSFDNSSAGNVRIFNNVIYQTNTTNQIARFARGINIRSTRKNNTVGDILIANNTFADLNLAAIMIKLDDHSKISADNPIHIVNNIIYNCDQKSKRQKYGIYVEQNNSQSVQIDYNLIHQGQSGGSFIKWGANSYSNEEFRQHSLGQMHGISDEPEFKIYSPFDTTNNYRLTAFSFAINNGISLRSEFISDKDGIKRDSQWDIGAFEFIKQ